MAVKLVSANKLFADPSIREAANGFIISLKAAGYEKPSVDALEFVGASWLLTSRTRVGPAPISLLHPTSKTI